MLLLDEKVFGKYEVKFPLDNELTILVGENGSGKTKVLEVLKEHYGRMGEKVLYFPEERCFSLNELDACWFAFVQECKEKVWFEKYNVKTDLMEFENLIGAPINAGIPQIVNIFGSIFMEKEEVIVIIDLPEKNLHITHQETLLSDILKQKNVKKLIAATHSPCILNDSFEDNAVIDVKKCINLLG